MTAYRGQGAPKPIPCGGCGAFFDASRATYGLDGKLACAACVSSGEISAAAERRDDEDSWFSRNWWRILIVIALLGLKMLIRFG